MARQLRLLHVEDSEDDARLALRELARAGFEVEARRVASAAALGAALAEGGWDLLLCDFALPGFSGIHALELVRAAGVETPVIMLSGTANEVQAVAALRAGARDFISKTTLGRLVPAVERELADEEERRALNAAEEALERQRKLHEATREQIDVGIVACDEHGRITLFNRAAREIHGLGAEPAPPESWAEHCDLFRADGRTRLAPDEVPLVRALAGESVRHAEVVVAPRGRPRRILFAIAQPLTGESARRLGAVVVLDDGTEERRQAAELERQREALAHAEKIAAMGELLAGVAHELNNPLSVVLGQAHLPAAALGDSPEAERVAKLEKAAERCARIVRSFLALARRHTPERRPVALGEVAEEALELLAYALRPAGVETRLDVEPGLPRVLGNAHQLHQVIVNLLSNAQQALRGVEPPRRIAVAARCDRERGEVVGGVADNGPGVPPEIAPRLFEPFFTTKPAGEGTGRGLSLSSAIAASHGGSLALAEAPGGGAEFRLELPAALPAEAPAEAAAERAPVPTGGARAAGRLAGAAILVVDDEPQLRDLLAELRRRAGYAVEMAEPGREALERLAARRFDLVLTDMRMPELDGPDLFREATRRDPRLGRRFVFLTGDTLAPDAIEFLEGGARRFLVKPFNLADVRRVVAEALAAAEGAAPPA